MTGDPMIEPLIRHPDASDHQPIIAVVDDWWGGRRMADMLPKLFFIHFQPTSFVAEHDGRIVAFLIGFVSQTFPEEAYIHFVGLQRLEFARYSVQSDAGSIGLEASFHLCRDTYVKCL
jgi:hypothetical protein